MRQMLRVDQPLDRLVQGDEGADQDGGDHGQPGQAPLGGQTLSASGRFKTARDRVKPRQDSDPGERRGAETLLR